MDRKVLILDTNAVLRFVVGNDAKMFHIAAHIINTVPCTVPIEVIAEAVFVMTSVYNYDRRLIADKIKEFITIKENLVVESEIVRYGANLFASTDFDFIDCILDGYAKIKGNPVFTFDGDLKKQLADKAFSGVN
ncbi:hypothetical protein AGMMS49944_20360 [Spirochaetia bacterium]|nr:hypothetical protein AGMMS49944_20360 [Spirochaetia bacterium]